MTERADNPTEIQEDDGLIFACRLNGDGTADPIGWNDVEAWTDGDTPIWMHMDHASARVRYWVDQKSGLTHPTAAALLAEETRPRIFRGKRGLVAILRGINRNPSSEAADMIALRMWSEGARVITIRKEPLTTARIILGTLLDQGRGPKTVSELYERMIAVVSERMAPTIAALDDRLDEVESQIDLTHASELRRRLSDIRQEAVVLRRYIAPQREALNDLLSDLPEWMDDTARPHLRETSDRLARYIEELDAARERAMVIRDDIANQMSEAMNKTLYALAVISGVFLPLAFLTGLLGINIGGMPGVDSDSAFWLFCGMILAGLVFELWIFRKLKWI